jgi:hypothetical protein
MNLSMGILIIGSLYWDDEGGRDLWRRWRLNSKRKWAVKAPIRYGRQSETRGNTYTMVFSRLKPKEFGQAIVLECQRRIHTEDDLMAEAKWLWAAEKKKVPPTEQGALPSSLVEEWGSVALLLRPGGCSQPLHSLLKRPVPGIPQQLLDRWSRVSSERDSDLIIADRGILDIAWPDRTDGGGPVPLSLLLATTNRPTDGGISSARSIADAWNAAPKFRNYFDANQPESGAPRCTRCGTLARVNSSRKAFTRRSCRRCLGIRPSRSRWTFTVMLRRHFRQKPRISLT